MLVRGMPSSPSSAGPGARGRGRAKSLIFPPWARRERGGAYPSPRIPLRRGAGMAYTVPDLSYPFDALEPHIDAKTMEIHHDKHHGAYVTNLNAALEGTEWMDHPIESVLAKLAILPDAKRTAARHHAGAARPRSPGQRAARRQRGREGPAPRAGLGDHVAGRRGRAGRVARGRHLGHVRQRR